MSLSDSDSSGSIEAVVSPPTSHAAAAADGQKRWTGANFEGMDELTNTPPNALNAPVPPSQIAADFDDMDKAIKEHIKDANKISTGMAPPLPPSRIAALVDEIDDDEEYGLKLKRKAAPATEADDDAPPPSPLPVPQIVEQEETLPQAPDSPTPAVAVARAPSPPPIDQGRGPSDPGGQPRIPVRPPPPSMMPRDSTMSTLFAHVSLARPRSTDDEVRRNSQGEYLIRAELVEPSEQGEVVVAEPVGYVAQRYKRIGFAMCFLFLVIIIAVSLSVTLRKNADTGQSDTPLPSMPPSPTPTFDLRPTLDIVQERGHVRCGSRHGASEIVTAFKLNMVSRPLPIFVHLPGLGQRRTALTEWMVG